MQKKGGLVLTSAKIAWQRVALPIKGLSPLLMNQYYDEIRAKVEGRYFNTDGKKRTKASDRINRDIPDEVQKKIYRLQDGRPGFPAAGFTTGIQEAATQFAGMTKKLVKGSVRAIPEEDPILIPIEHEGEVMMAVHVGRQPPKTGTPKTLYRPEFRNWRCMLPLEYDESVIALEDIIALLNYAGEHSGLGDYRPSGGGGYGRYIVTSK